eukprot:5326269-Pyramimonas_sp.AAC.1
MSRGSEMRPKSRDAPATPLACAPGRRESSRSCPCPPTWAERPSTSSSESAFSCGGPMLRLAQVA